MDNTSKYEEIRGRGLEVIRAYFDTLKLPDGKHAKARYDEARAKLFQLLTSYDANLFSDSDEYRTMFFRIEKHNKDYVLYANEVMVSMSVDGSSGMVGPSGIDLNTELAP